MHCPLNVPLAVRHIFLAVARWIAQIDDANKARDFALMASTWSPSHTNEALYFNWSSRWVRTADSKGRDQEEPESKLRALRSSFAQKSSGSIPAASASSCLGRLTVVFVRNPVQALSICRPVCFLGSCVKCPRQGDHRFQRHKHQR